MVRINSELSQKLQSNPRTSEVMPLLIQEN
jgi:hypothetical protein